MENIVIFGNLYGFQHILAMAVGFGCKKCIYDKYILAREYFHVVGVTCVYQILKMVFH